MSNIGTVRHIPKDVRYNFLNVSPQHLEDEWLELIFVQMAAPASYVAGLGRG